MAKWIAFTSSHDGTRIYLNMDNAIRIQDGGPGHTRVGFPAGDGIENVPVRESVDEVAREANS